MTRRVARALLCASVVSFVVVKDLAGPWGMVPMSGARAFAAGPLDNPLPRGQVRIYSYAPKSLAEGKAAAEAMGLKVLEEIPEASLLFCIPARATNGENVGGPLALVPNHQIRQGPPAKANEERPSAAGLEFPRDGQIPNDTMIWAQWGMFEARAPRVWQSATTSDIVVAVLSTGIDYTHRDLSENMWVNRGEIPGNGIDDDHNGITDDVHGVDFASTGGQIATGDPMDQNGVGTHCAGIIGAVGNNAIGVTGVNWRVKLMAVKVFDSTGSGQLVPMLLGVNYARRMGAKVVYLGFSSSAQASQEWNLLAKAISAADQQGLLIVAPAGNDAVNIDATPVFPASLRTPNMLSVLAIDRAEHVASYSNVGKRTVDLAAPGGMSGGRDGSDILSTVPGSTYGSQAGTSAAAAHVAGAAALVWGQPQFSKYSPAQIKSLLLNGTRRLPALEGKCVTGGTLDLSFMAR